MISLLRHNLAKVSDVRWEIGFTFMNQRKNEQHEEEMHWLHLSYISWEFEQRSSGCTSTLVN